MEPKTAQFEQGAADALQNPKVQQSLRGLYAGFHTARLDAAAATSDWEELRERGRAIKTHTVEHLDYYLEMAERNVRAARRQRLLRGGRRGGVRVRGEAGARPGR